MARSYAPLLTAIWEDPDWKALSSTDHDVFVALLTSSDLSRCGVALDLPSRYVEFAADLTERKVAKALANLAARRFIVRDTSTSEVLVRNYVRHDGVIRRPMIARAMAKATDKVRSPKLRREIATQFARIRAEEPDAPGWRHVEELAPDLVEQSIELYGELFAELYGGQSVE